MRIISTIGQRWKQAIGASLTIALLSAVAVVGITFFGSEVVAAWKTPGNSEQRLASTGTLGGLLNFEAPASTVARVAAEKEQDGQSKDSSALLAKNWRFTDNPFVDRLMQSYQLYFQSLLLRSYEAAFLNFLNTLAANNPGFAPVAQQLEQAVIPLFTAFANLLALQQAIINSQLPPQFQAPHTLPASPSA